MVQIQLTYSETGLSETAGFGSFTDECCKRGE